MANLETKTKLVTTHTLSLTEEELDLLRDVMDAHIEDNPISAATPPVQAFLLAVMRLRSQLGSVVHDLLCHGACKNVTVGLPITPTTAICLQCGIISDYSDSEG